MKRRTFLKSLSAACMGIAATLYAPGVLGVIEPVEDRSLWFEASFWVDRSRNDLYFLDRLGLWKLCDDDGPFLTGLCT